MAGSNVIQKEDVKASPTPARLHAIIARERRRAVVFRRGPSKKVAVIGWNLNSDEFTPGQWFKGRIYEYRCDLSPDGNYLLYFAAKYGTNPVEARIEELVKTELGEFDWGNYSEKNYLAYRKRAEALEEEIRRSHAGEFEKLRRSSDYTDGSWTAISRTPYLKALDLWFNGSGWNGGGWFVDATHVWINRPHPIRGDHFHHTVSGKFTELAESPDPYLITENNGECPGIYWPRLERDGWKPGKESELYTEFSRELPGGYLLLKRFYTTLPRGDGYGCYWEEHELLGGGKRLLDGRSWRWADYDAGGKRVLFAEAGAIYSWSQKKPDAPPVLLHDFNDMKYEEIAAPY